MLVRQPPPPISNSYHEPSHAALVDGALVWWFWCSGSDDNGVNNNIDRETDEYEDADKDDRGRAREIDRHQTIIVTKNKYFVIFVANW